MLHFDKQAIRVLKEMGTECRKKATSTIFVKQYHEPFEVETNEGMITGKSGDYLATDGEMHVWPVSKEYFEKYYEEVK